MKKHKLSIFVVALLLCQFSFAQSAVVRQYIERFKDAAIAEMQRTGVPAAITLAQGIHESSAGQSELVLASNNHFGIKCKEGWTGETVSHDDDAKGECFRKYNDPFESYRDHSDFLKNRGHYAALFKLDPTDYEGWAYGLKKAGYATNPKYPQILIKIIRDYHLQDYTLIALGNKGPVKAEENVVVADNNAKNKIAVSQKDHPEGIFKINETSAVFVHKGTSYLAIAEKYDVSLSKLFDYNEMRPQDIASEDGVIFIQRKRKTGSNPTHVVVAGETLREIAQAEGVRLENLLAYNYLSEGMQPESGQFIYLQKQAPAMPKLIRINNEAYASHTQFTPQTIAVNYIVHIVKAKETAFSIARKYEVSVDDLLRWNNLATADLNIGQELRINKKATNATN